MSPTVTLTLTPTLPLPLSLSLVVGRVAPLRDRMAAIHRHQHRIESNRIDATPCRTKGKRSQAGRVDGDQHSRTRTGKQPAASQLCPSPSPSRDAACFCRRPPPATVLHVQCLPCARRSAYATAHSRSHPDGIQTDQRTTDNGMHMAHDTPTTGQTEHTQINQSKSNRSEAKRPELGDVNPISMRSSYMVRNRALDSRSSAANDCFISDRLTVHVTVCTL